MKNSKWIGVAVGILIVVSLVVLFARLRQPSRNLGFDLPEYIGSQLAEQALALLTEGGEILFIKPDMPGVQDTYAGAYQRGFTQTIASKAKGVTVTEIGLTADPMELQAGKPFFGAAELTRLVREYPQGKVFVSVAGIPAVTRRQLSTWNETYPEMVVFAPFGGPVEPLLRAGVLDAAIVPRTGEDPDWENTGTSIQDIFAQDYEILSP